VKTKILKKSVAGKPAARRSGTSSKPSAGRGPDPRRPRLSSTRSRDVESLPRQPEDIEADAMIATEAEKELSDFGGAQERSPTSL
jgi:hypothetical protein